MSNKLSKLDRKDDSEDQKIVEQFWTDIYPRLQDYCQFLTKSKWDGDDIAQEAIIKAIQHYTREEDITPALVKKIAYHHWIDTIRKRTHEIVEVSLEQFPSEKKHLLHIEMIDSYLLQLTPKQAVVFILKEGFQFTANEVAEILNTTETAVKAVLHRAKNQLYRVKESEDTSNSNIIWQEIDNQKLVKLFYQSIQLNDPTPLIEAIPKIRSLSTTPVLSLGQKYTRTMFSPTCNFSMAA